MLHFLTVVLAVTSGCELGMELIWKRPTLVHIYGGCLFLLSNEVYQTLVPQWHYMKVSLLTESLPLVSQNGNFDSFGSTCICALSKSSPFYLSTFLEISRWPRLIP